MRHIGKVSVAVLFGIQSMAFGGAVGQVEVTDLLPEERKKRWQAIGGQAALRDAVETELARSGVLAAGSGKSVQVTVRNYRMRPGTTRPWSGTGRAARPYRYDHLGREGDAIDMAVEVREGETVLRSYTVAARSKDTPGRRDTATRMAKLASAGARRVVEQLAAAN